jgi:hypothetical protein
MKDPKPRDGRFMGMAIVNTVFPDGTWVEGEEFAYPDDTWTRQAWADCEDGKRRMIQCKTADSYFTIPARIVSSPYVYGFLSIKGEGESQGLHFTRTEKTPAGKPNGFPKNWQRADHDLGGEG